MWVVLHASVGRWRPTDPDGQWPRNPRGRRHPGVTAWSGDCAILSVVAGPHHPPVGVAGAAMRGAVSRFLGQVWDKCLPSWGMFR
jgi:hypothetical protein